MPPTDTFVVEDINQAHGFARLRAEGGSGLVHSGLFPEQPGGELSPLRLQVGDRVSGLRRGQTLSQVRWLGRALPPRERVAQVEELLRRLAARGLPVSVDAEAVADHHWREGPGSPLLDALAPQLRFFFDPAGTHPFEDARLLERVEGATAEHLPGFSVRPVPGVARFQVEPGAHVIAGGEPDWEDPTQLFDTLVEHINQELGRAGATVRWTPVRGDWVLAPQDVVDLLVHHGVLQGRASA
jgi:hypothetical protein